jgi:hypothetical protein
MRETFAFPRRALPRLARVRQHLPSDQIAEVSSQTNQRLLDAGLRDRIEPGNRIAITTGSRRKGGVAEVLSGVVQAAKEAGGEFFLIPAMGSRGGATSDGQTEILFGVAVIENAYRQPAAIEVLPPHYDAFLEADIRRLKTAKTYLATIPFDKLDLLVVDEVGRDASGTGMDLNIIGRRRLSGGRRTPDFLRIVAFSLAATSLGNGPGIGLADFTTERFAAEIDPAVTYINLLTAAGPNAINTREGMLPLALLSDREAMEAALYSALAEVRPGACRIRRTNAIDEFYVSEAMLDEVGQNPKLSIVEPPGEVQFMRRATCFSPM